MTGEWTCRAVTWQPISAQIRHVLRRAVARHCTALPEIKFVPMGNWTKVAPSHTHQIFIPWVFTEAKTLQLNKTGRQLSLLEAKFKQVSYVKWSRRYAFVQRTCLPVGLVTIARCQALPYSSGITARCALPPLCHHLISDQRRTRTPENDRSFQRFLTVC